MLKSFKEDPNNLKNLAAESIRTQIHINNLLEKNWIDYITPFWNIYKNIIKGYWYDLENYDTHVTISLSIQESPFWTEVKLP